MILVLVLFWATLPAGRQAFRPTSEVLWLAFFSGLMVDLARGAVLGARSFFFLLSSGLVLLYRRKFDPNHFLFLPIFVFLESLIYGWFFSHVWSYKISFVLAVFAFLISRLAQRFIKPYER